MKIALLALACGGSLLIGYRSPAHLVGSISAAYLGFIVGREDASARSPDIQEIRENAATAAIAHETEACDRRLESLRRRMESRANEECLAKMAEAIAPYRAQLAAANEALQQQSVTSKDLEAQHQRAIAQLCTDHESTCSELQRTISRLEGIIKAHDRDMSTIARFRSDEKALRLQMQYQERDAREQKAAIEKMKRTIAALQDHAIEQYSAGHEVGVESGRTAAIEHYKTEIERLELRFATAQAKIAELEATISGKARADRLDRELPELLDVVKASLKPIICEGSQGSGKALAIANAMYAYADGQPVVAFALDISEGGDPDSTWKHLGVPCTDDPGIFIEYLVALTGALETRPHRNDRAAYDAMPPCFAIIDEAMCAFDSIEKEVIEQTIKPCLRAIESRGHKRKVWPIVATQDGQIQNLKARGISLWNTGSLKNYYKILLNDGLLAQLSQDDFDRSPNLAEHIDLHDGKFIAAIETMSARGRIKKPIKHPSHHGQPLTNTIPTRGVELLPIAPPPAWMPSRVAAAYAGDRAGDATVPGDDRQSLEPLPQQECPPVTTNEISRLAEEYRLSPDEVSLILASGHQPMTRAIGAIATKSGRPNSKYQRARSLYLSRSTSF